MGISTELPQLDATELATSRYLEALTELTDDQAREPSVLPGWTRGHVVTHLARNADAFTHVVHQVLSGEPAWMYESQESRDSGVESGAARSAAALREDAAWSSGRLLQAFNELHPRHLDTGFARLPGGPAFGSVRELPARRRTEVEIHHADLGLGYGPDDWPREFALDLVTRRQDELGLDGPSIVLRASDGPEVWKLGSGAGPDVTGTAARLAWWLVGRGGGSGLGSSTGELPTLPRWR